MQPGPPRSSDSFVIARSVVAGYTFPVSGSVHLGRYTSVSRGMLTTDMLLRSAETCSSIWTSARGGLPKVSLAPPSFWFSSLSRASEPISRMFSGVWPAAFASAFIARSFASPMLRGSFFRLLLRCW